MEWNPEHMRKKDDPQWRPVPRHLEAEDAHRQAMMRAPDVMAVRAQVAFRESEAGRALAEAQTTEERAAKMRAILQASGLVMPVGDVSPVPAPVVPSVPLVEAPRITPEQVVQEIQAAAAAEKAAKK